MIPGSCCDRRLLAACPGTHRCASELTLTSNTGTVLRGAAPQTVIKLDRGESIFSLSCLNPMFFRNLLKHVVFVIVIGDGIWYWGQV